MIWLLKFYNHYVSECFWVWKFFPVGMKNHLMSINPVRSTYNIFALLDMKFCSEGSSVFVKSQGTQVIPMVNSIVPQACYQKMFACLQVYMVKFTS